MIVYLKLIILNIFFFQLSNCEDLNSREWKIKDGKITFYKAATGYNVDIEFTKECAVIRNELFDKLDLDIINELEIGPDEIIIQLEGASVQGKVATSTDFCRNYHTTFQIPKSGVYNLKVIKLRSNYLACKDGEFYPRIKYEELLNEKISNNLDVYIPQPCQQHEGGYWVSSDEDLGYDFFNEYPIKITDSCKNHRMHRGLPIRTNIILEKEMKENRCAEDIHSFAWNRNICLMTENHRDKKLVPEIIEFGHPSLTQVPKEWFKGKKILFIGDSHMVGLAEHFLSYICEYNFLQMKLKKRDTESVKIKTHNHLGSNVVDFFQMQISHKDNIEFRKILNNCRNDDPDLHKCEAWNNAYTPQIKEDMKECFYNSSSPKCNLYDMKCETSSFAILEAMYCQKGIVDYMRNYDYVIFNCGHHPAKSHLYTYSTYREVVEELSHRLESFQKQSKTQLFYLESVANPLRQDKIAVHEKDKRTYHRLMIMDAIAKKAFKPLGVKIIPAFSASLSMFDKFCDCGHYPWSIKMPQIISLVGMIDKDN